MFVLLFVQTIYLFRKQGDFQIGSLSFTYTEFKHLQQITLYDIFTGHRLAWIWKLASTQNSMNWKDLCSQSEMHINIAYRGTSFTGWGEHLWESHFTIQFTTNFILEKLNLGLEISQPHAAEWILLFHTVYENKSSTLLPVIFKKICCFYSLYLILKGKKKYSDLAFRSLTLNSYKQRSLCFSWVDNLINFAWK